MTNLTIKTQPKGHGVFEEVQPQVGPRGEFAGASGLQSAENNTSITNSFRNSPSVMCAEANDIIKN